MAAALLLFCSASASIISRRGRRVASLPPAAGSVLRSVRNEGFCRCLASRALCSSSSSSSSWEPRAAAETGDAPSTSSDPVKEAAEALDLRVGRVLKAWRHPEAESLYVEEVDVGEAETRTICSGLVNYIPLEHLQQFSEFMGQNMAISEYSRAIVVSNSLSLPVFSDQDIKVVVLANLKPRNMRGIKSNGMLMAASDESHETVELLMPPENSVPGERIWFGLEEDKDRQPDAATPNQVQKKKIWESVQPHLRTTDSCVAVLGVHLMRTSAGVVACRSLKNARIS